MIVGAVGALLIAVCIGQLARHVTSAGGIYSYAATVFGDTAGFLVGWIYSVLYLLIICLVAISISLTGGDFLKHYFNVSPPQWVLSIALIAFTSVMSYVGIRPSTAVTVTLGLIEVTLILAVAALLIFKGGHANSISLFNPARAAGASSGIARSLFLGVVFAFSMVAGFEAAVPLAEETKSARRVVPKAVVSSAAVIGLFYVVAGYAGVVGWGPSRLSSMIKSANPWREMAAHVGGAWALLIVLAILNSQVAGAQACFNASSRLFFAASRNRVLPPSLSRIHPRWKTPHVAATATALTALVVTFVTKAAFHGARPAYAFFLTVNTLIFLVVYAIVCIATIVFFTTKMRAELRPGLHVVVPVLALCVLAPAVYYSLKGLTYPASAAIPSVVAWAVLGALVLAVLRRRRVDISAEGQRWLHEDTSEPVEARD
jgi:amino acid transporter